jgi:hypothetical protein
VYYAVVLEDGGAAAMDVEHAGGAESSFGDALQAGKLHAASLDVRVALYDGVKLLADGAQEVFIIEVDLKKVDAIGDLTTQEKSSLYCDLDADAEELYSRCEVRVHLAQCAAAQTARRWHLRSETANKRYIQQLRKVMGKDRSPQVPGPIAVFGSFSLWVEDFDAEFRDQRTADSLMNQLLCRRP